ncbi:hypothetical protein FB451DRAFT_440111 [Mycena latifolia]|nr:hypothetical protein FB451DRAFT_440111 [Mycena latifolia]
MNLGETASQMNRCKWKCSLWSPGTFTFHLHCVAYHSPSITSAPVHIYVPLWVGQVGTFWLFPDTANIYTDGRDVHGDPGLPDGYAFAFVPCTARVEPLRGGNPILCPSIGASVVKGLAALAQTLATFYTLYPTRGDQISRYGYAAFGLTVLPYSVMSIINLIAAIMTPEFQALYMVQSDILLEAQQRAGTIFEGVVGKLLPAAHNADLPRLSENTSLGNVVARELGEDGGELLGIDIESTPSRTLDFSLATHEDHRFVIDIPACTEFQRYDSKVLRSSRGKPALSVLPMIVMSAVGVGLVLFGTIAALTNGFDSGQSTKAQRTWMLVWLAMGVVTGPAPAIFHVTYRSNIPTGMSGNVANLISICSWGAPAFGLFSVVAKMIWEYGNCTKFD